MIDISQSRAGLLAEIDARDPVGDPLSDLTDPRVATADAYVRVCGREREDLFPLLRLALSERFAAVPRLELFRDLLIPLRNALGNAYKHGNGSDPAKAVRVELALTRKGALIAITDEGTGFDVALTFRRFQEQQAYFVNHGAGFINLHRARSTVSYENGGRTVLLCYRSSQTDSAQGLEAEEALPKVLDAEWLQTCFSAELPEFENNGARVESCSVYPTSGRSSDECGHRYVLRIANVHGGPAGTRILTGRLHPTTAAAAADSDAATWLREANISKSVLIPRVARLAEAPRLVLYDFDPWMDLAEYFTYRGSLKSLRHGAARIGRALARLHRSQVGFPHAEPDPGEEGFQEILAGAETTLQTLPAGSELVNRFRVAVQRILERAALRRRQPLAPIHGALGWDCILFGTDGHFYLYRFERCRRSDPGFDLGGFAADLLCFTLAGDDDGTYRTCCEAFLSKYNSEAEHPMDEDDLPFYIALALSERLRRLEPRARAQACKLLAALDATLAYRGRAVSNQVST